MKATRIWGLFVLVSATSWGGDSSGGAQAAYLKCFQEFDQGTSYYKDGDKSEKLLLQILRDDKTRYYFTDSGKAFMAEPVNSYENFDLTLGDKKLIVEPTLGTVSEPPAKGVRVVNHVQAKEVTTNLLPIMHKILMNDMKDLVKYSRPRKVMGLQGPTVMVLENGVASIQGGIPESREYMTSDRRLEVLKKLRACIGFLKGAGETAKVAEIEKHISQLAGELNAQKDAPVQHSEER